MKKYLLLASALLVVSGASAQQYRRSETAKPQKMQTEIYQPQVQVQEMQMRTPGTPVAKVPKKASSLNVHYTRPAGAFTSNLVVEDGAYQGAYYAPYVFLKPYADYTFHGTFDPISDEQEIYWDYQYWSSSEQVWGYTEGENDLTISYGYEADSVPIFTVYDGNTFGTFNLKGHKMGGTYSNPTIEATYSSYIASIPSAQAAWEQDMPLSSKNFCYGGENGNHYYAMTYYSGATAYGTNETGWWFGKNGSHIDGIAQAFEKPEHPYLLNGISMLAAVLELKANVDMTCKVYKLDYIPAYDEESLVTLAEEPGELIATGRATVTPETDDQTNGLVTFTLYGEEDGLEYEITPTIDYPILVVVDGYNDDSMANLTDFSAMVSADFETDEGFGELAYVKYPMKDDDGNFTGEYVWAGLNNFFSIGEMKTGFTLFINAELPFLTYNYTLEDGEYTFPLEGGVMEKELAGEDGTVYATTKSIEFFAWTPSADEGWTLSCNGGDVPSWLTIELQDGEEDGEFNNLVNAVVTAEPLPESVNYREAVVRFEFPGAYLDYKFMQGVKSGVEGDVNGDGQVTIADINAVIEMILNNSTSDLGDVNGDGKITVADVNAIINIMLASN